MKPLTGVKVVSINHFLVGPAAMQTLGDLGADVIAVEPLDGAFQRKWAGADQYVDGQSVLFLCANRNKRSVAVDLKTERGVEIVRRLMAEADVVAENFRPGVMERLGLGYETLKADNPGLIYAVASGYGADGPYVERPGQDMLIQALSGLAAVTGDTGDGARAVGVSAVDHHGAMILAMSILAALLERNRTGQGCRVDVNLLTSALDLQMEALTCFLNGGGQDTVRHPPYSGGWMFPPPYGIYPTTDGHLAISLVDLSLLADIFRDESLTALAGDVYKNGEAICAAVARATSQRSTGEWEATLTAHKIWHAPVNDYAAVVKDPQVRHLDSFATLEGATGTPVHVVRHPVRYDGRTPEIERVPQPLGAQTREVLQELGYGEQDIEDMIAAGVVGAQDAPPATP